MYTCCQGLEVKPCLYSCPDRSAGGKYSHRVTLPLPSHSSPRPLEPRPQRPGPAARSCGSACLGGGEPERLDGEWQRPGSAPPSRSSWREGEELSERWSEDEELRRRCGGLRSNPPRSCMSWVRLAKKSASLVLLARTLKRRRLRENKPVRHFCHVGSCGSNFVFLNVSHFQNTNNRLIRI